MTRETPRTARRDQLLTRFLGAVGSLALLAALVAAAQALGITSRGGFKLFLLLVMIGCVTILAAPELLRPKSGGKRKKLPAP